MFGLNYLLFACEAVAAPVEGAYYCIWIATRATGRTKE